MNLWRAAEFTGGADVEVVAATPAAIADFLAQGSPALLSLAMSLNGAPAGGHFVVATGIAADGSIVIQDPSPLFARTSLTDYLNGFNAAGGAWKAALRGVARFALRSPLSTRFLVAALSQPATLLQSLATDISSAAGPCGQPFEAFDSVDSSGNPAAGALLSRLTACDGAQPAYQIQIGTGQPFHAQLTDLAPGRVVHRSLGQRPGHLPGDRARSSISPWHRRPSASRRPLSSMGPPSLPELPRAEWYPYLAPGYRGRAKLPRWIWTEPRCACCSRRRFRSMRRCR